MTPASADVIPTDDVYAKARFNMVESQIRTNKVTDSKLLAALSRIPRQIFVPTVLAGVAYVDKSLRIAPNRYLQEPLVIARLLQEAVVEPDDKVLVIGAGTGYSAALLARGLARLGRRRSKATPALADAARREPGARWPSPMPLCMRGRWSRAWPRRAPMMSS